MKKSKITDFDPESLLDPAPSSSSDENSDAAFSDAEDTNAGREHYQNVGKSKLRRKEEVPLGPQYAGRGISRNELEDSDSDDPFARGFDEDASEDDDDAEDDEDDEDMSGEEEDDEDEELDSGDEDEDEDEDDEDENEDDDSNASEDEASGGDASNNAMVRDLMKGSKAFSATIAAGEQSDVAKGQAVKTQRKTFDTLLNTRIRLQKALISTNSLVAEPHKAETAPESSVEAAEAAALALLNSLTDLRLSMEDARTGEKRKRTTFDSKTTSSEIWSSIKDAEKAAQPNRKAVLERWSKKTKATTVTNNKARLNAAATQTLTEVLDSQLTSDHLVARTQMPRSCAPIQSSAKAPQPDPAIYDDADFYGLLLKELLEQRSSDLNTNGTAEFVVQAPWQVARDAKTKKVVDTKASKGRRLRYTVQEKIQNFMAPEERGEWGDRQRDDLFSSLFGQKLGLGEQEEEGSEGEDGVDAEEAGLMLFRS